MYKWIAASFAALLIIAITSGCSRRTTTEQEPASGASEAVCESHTGHHAEGHKHKAPHGGSLNAIVACENGHAEVKLDGSTLRVWFVGGGPNTTKSVRIPDKSISLGVDTSKGVKTLILKPKPLELAGEEVGDCSCFEATAPWLSGIAKFSAKGDITLRGARTPLIIEYPEGYDPD